MAIAYDTSTKITDGTSPRNWSHTCSGSDRILFVEALTLNDTLTGITYAGTSMTQLAKTTFPGVTRRGAYLYYLINPSSGSHSIIATSSSGNITCGATSFTGAKQSGVPDSSATKDETTASATAFLATTVVNSGCWLIGAVADDQGSGGTGLSGAIVRQTSPQGFIFGDSNGTVGTGSQTLTFDAAASNIKYGMIVASFAPSASGPTNLKTYNTNTKSNIKTINTNAIANVKSLNTNV